VTVTETFANEMRELGARGPIVTIPNGCDFDEFDGLSYQPSERFRITHTGSFFGQRSAGPFLEALHRSDPAIIARFAGDFRSSERELLNRYELGGRVELLGFVPRRRSLALQRDSDALLLLLPEIGGRGKDVPSGKLYEYLAAERPILAAVPQDGTAAGLIEATGAGIVVAPDDVEAMTAELNRLASQWRNGTLAAPSLSPEWKAKLSRTSRAGELLAVLDQVTCGPRRGR
jgi:glycosyltransferase involved in cell wall biosynthesis